MCAHVGCNKPSHQGKILFEPPRDGSLRRRRFTYRIRDGGLFSGHGTNCILRPRGVRKRGRRGRMLQETPWHEVSCLHRGGRSEVPPHPDPEQTESLAAKKDAKGEEHIPMMMTQRAGSAAKTICRNSKKGKSRFLPQINQTGNCSRATELCLLHSRQIIST